MNRSFLPLISAGVLLAGGAVTVTAIHSASAAAAPSVPAFDHIVIVTEENQDASTIATQAPYLDSLAAGGADFTNSHGVDHPSEGNYLALYSGSDQGLTDESCPMSAGSVPNIYTQLGGAVASFTESLPSNPSGCQVGDYVPWHNASSYFTNVPKTADLPFSSFPSDYTKLPKVSYVAANMQDDMHDGSVQQGDDWAKTHLGSYAQWAKTHNSLLIVTTDESDTNATNQVFTVFYGANVTPGKYTENISHLNVFRTVEAAFGQPGIGDAATLAPITDVWSGSVTPPSNPPPTSTVPPVTSGSTPPPTSGTPAPPAGNLPNQQNFTLSGEDTFSGSTVDTSKWGVYSDRPDCVEGNGVLTEKGNPDGSTCGMAWLKDQVYGQWTVTAKFPAPAATQFDATFILWPQDDAVWKNAEIDYVEETDAARQSLESFVHCTACSGGQVENSANVDMTQWHTYAVQWTPAAIVGFIDGKPWFTVTDKAAISTVPHHATIQMDYNPDGGAVGATTVQVKDFKVYAYTPSVTPPPTSSGNPPSTSSVPPPPTTPVTSTPAPPTSATPPPPAAASALSCPAVKAPVVGQKITCTYK